MNTRELIPREYALMALTGNFNIGLTMNEYVLSCKKHINAIQAISEQEIVKPYLDNLITRIQKLRGCSCSISDGIIDDVEDIIEKLLSEDGKE